MAQTDYDYSPSVATLLRVEIDRLIDYCRPYMYADRISDQIIGMYAEATRFLETALELRLIDPDAGREIEAQLYPIQRKILRQQNLMY